MKALMRTNQLIEHTYNTLRASICSDNSDYSTTGKSNEDLLHDELIKALDKGLEFKDTTEFINYIKEQVKINLWRLKAGNKEVSLDHLEGYNDESDD